MACQDAELDRLHELFANVGTSTRQPDQDCSAAQWLRQHGASERMLSGMFPALFWESSPPLWMKDSRQGHVISCSCVQSAVAEACYANDFGCSLEQLGLTELIIENQRWNAGLVLIVPNSASHACPTTRSHII